MNDRTSHPEARGGSTTLAFMPQPPNVRTTRVRAHRRGATYSIVLILSIVLTMIGMSAAYLSRVTIRTQTMSNDWSTSQQLAASGLEHALLQVGAAIHTAETTGDDWRIGFAHNDIVATHAMGDGHFYWRVADATGDEDLADDPQDAVLLIATGEVGNTRHSLQVRMEPVTESTNALPCLDAAIHTNTGIVIQNFTVVEADHVVRTNDGIALSNATMNADVEAVSYASGSTYTAGKLTGIEARDLPASAVFDYYVQRGTAINFSSLPSGPDGKRKLVRVVLSPASNPYGTENAEGIYVIDCQDDPIEIKYSRIVGTLVLLNAGSGSKIDRAVNWEPAIPNYPALLVGGDIKLDFDDEDLRESGTSSGRAKNFNPIGTPWQTETDGMWSNDWADRDAAENGETPSDSVHNDVYPSVIAGLIYVDGDVTVNENRDPTIEGSLIVDGSLTMMMDGSLTVMYRDAAYLDPPPGFRMAGLVRMTPGSVVQVLE